MGALLQVRMNDLLSRRRTGRLRVGKATQTGPFELLYLDHQRPPWRMQISTFSGREMYHKISDRLLLSTFNFNSRGQVEGLFGERKPTIECSVWLPFSWYCSAPPGTRPRRRARGEPPLGYLNHSLRKYIQKTVSPGTLYLGCFSHSSSVLPKD